MSNSFNETTNTNSPADASGLTVIRSREAYQKALPAAEALETHHLISINLDIPSAVTTAIGALPEILALRDEAKDFPHFDVRNLDELSTYARATMHAHAEYLAASSPPEALLALNEEGLKLRDTLYSDAVALANRGLINGAPLDDFKKAIGYKNVATDLAGLAALLRNNWSRIAGKTPLTLAELDRAEDLSDQLLTAVGAREQAPLVVADVAMQRQRMFTLFVNAYDQARRIISYLRWDEDDLETIAPSLYAGRKRGKNNSEPAPAPVVPAPGVPAPGVSAVAAPAAAAKVPVGHPGSDPFSVS